MCFLMDPLVGRDVCYIQFPQRFDGIDRSDRYANRNTVFFDVSLIMIEKLLPNKSCKKIIMEVVAFFLLILG